MYRLIIPGARVVDGTCAPGYTGPIIAPLSGDSAGDAYLKHMPARVGS